MVYNLAKNFNSSRKKKKTRINRINLLTLTGNGREYSYFLNVSSSLVMSLPLDEPQKKHDVSIANSPNALYFPITYSASSKFFYVTVKVGGMYNVHPLFSRDLDVSL